MLLLDMQMQDRCQSRKFNCKSGFKKEYFNFVNAIEKKNTSLRFVSHRFLGIFDKKTFFLTDSGVVAIVAVVAVAFEVVLILLDQE